MSDELRKEISKYLVEFKINELMSFLSRMVFHFKPEDPVAFLANVLLDLKASTEDGHPIDALYPEQSLKAYFRLLDPAGEGLISSEQLKSAMYTMGIKGVDLPIDELGPASEEMFVQLCQKNFEKDITIKRDEE